MLAPSVSSGCENVSGPDGDTSAPSLTQQHSYGIDPTIPKRLERTTSKKLQEEWDKDIPVIPLTKLLKKNAPEWWMIALGLIGCMISGAVTPLFSLFFGRILSVFANPPDKVFPLVHPWAGLFIALAIVSAVAAYLKVCIFI